MERNTERDRESDRDRDRESHGDSKRVRDRKAEIEKVRKVEGERERVGAGVGECGHSSGSNVQELNKPSVDKRVGRERQEKQGDQAGSSDGKFKERSCACGWGSWERRAT